MRQTIVQPRSDNETNRVQRPGNGWDQPKQFSVDKSKTAKHDRRGNSSHRNAKMHVQQVAPFCLTVFSVLGFDGPHVHVVEMHQNNVDQVKDETSNELPAVNGRVLEKVKSRHSKNRCNCQP